MCQALRRSGAAGPHPNHPCRRADRINLSQGEQKDRYQVKDLVVDTARHQVFVGSEEIHFTQNEFKILELLCLHAGKGTHL